jgi:hypothetical protein
MGWSGSDFQRTHNFSADASAGINILASRMDAEFDNFETGLEACLKLDGTNNPAADFPMGGFKHTNVGAATSTNNYLRLDQYQQQTPIWCAYAGPSDVFSVSTSPVFNALVTGHTIIVSCPSVNTTTSVVIKLNGLSAKDVKLADGSDLGLGDVIGLRKYTYTGTQWVLENPARRNIGASTAYTSVVNFVSASVSFGSTATIFDGFEQVAVGYRDIPIIVMEIGRTLTVNDRGHLLTHATTSTLDFTIPTCASVPIPLGGVFVIQNRQNGGVVSVSAASGVTMFRAGTGSTGVRILSAACQGQFVKVAANAWSAGGAGIT